MSREEEILAIVSKKKKIEVNELSELLNVSKVTIRKDLDKLEARGLLHRQHGYALLNNLDDINYRLAQNYELKHKIALEASQIVNDGETIMIESGSTCALLAEELAFNRRDITIITNSCFIASYVRKAESVKVILIGGEYQKESQVNVGPLVKQVVNEFYVDKLFIGIDGFDRRRGFTGSDITRCDTTRMLATAANQTIILTDSSKFSQNGVVSEFAFNEISQVFTDKRIDSTILDFLKKEAIDVFTV
ncbi:DeoR/GlpR family DNA-binding transcription regulator [Enterococcus dongliensis]|uniref:DeoR/GlpR family DNA-binding transcription regulator n=1 Tax=Enterococcus dongliensis TaxID=2559925 RepID=UPI002890BD73|nr:DeoR/GlpR family DNA-binding transcription regulator [Enterococcus dongliensis]MDT2614326.1 DeoR/GlpR family DNA-binding transcription regulator [Enterococcus dongliensis]MDT2638751.1 DeoR/GlpR family DNA-binding transcription regulator [Enterococcus dongliensis]MDT2672624.1 DeoR/GlpR family DNA-binding transcription regulator [Enterococcus dongliensis]MDT2677863.1 DeoR/GlpR family DNA-binding transcription regulator [Enterococcus dongliensis]MDT2703475.1 DeoR/GlpR family DNA-binding transc